MSLLLPAAPAWFRHRVGDGVRLGVVDPSRPEAPWFDVGPADELTLLHDGRLDAAHLQDFLGAATARVDPPRFEVPIGRPGKLLCLGKNFAAHAAEFGADVPEEPIFFTKLPDTLLPHGGTVLLPHWVTTRIDHEVELAVVLGFADPDRRGRRDVAAARALDLVAGYSILNDVTARTMQGEDRKQQRPWLRCKSFDTFCPLGPWVVPAASLPHIADARIRLTVDGALRQDSRTSKMVVDVAHAIAYLSRHTTLRPGDVIAMGTPEGVGPLQPGNHVVCAIEGLGELHHGVAREETPPHAIDAG